MSQSGCRVVLEVDECADRVLDRYRVIDRMQLVELDAFKPQPSQAVRTGAAQMLGSTISDPTHYDEVRHIFSRRGAYRRYKVGAGRTGGGALIGCSSNASPTIRSLAAAGKPETARMTPPMIDRPRLGRRL
jgi:hypothetical protein